MRKGPYTRERVLLRELVRELREEAQISQRELAQRLGVAPSLVCRFERGDRRLDLPELGEIGQALGITLSEIVRRYERVLVEKKTPQSEGTLLEGDSTGERCDP